MTAFTVEKEVFEAMLEKDLSEKMKFVVVSYEGCRRRAYIDTTGHKTIGIGFNLDRPGASAFLRDCGVLDVSGVCSGVASLTTEQINLIYLRTFTDCVFSARRRVKNFDELPEIVRGIVSDMIFNMGEGAFSKFKRLIAALERDELGTAANEMANSSWGKKSNRARQYVPMMCLVADDIEELLKPSVIEAMKWHKNPEVEK